MIHGVALSWSTDVAAGGWLVERIVGFGRDVGSVVPHGFGAYARVFHPLEEPERRWADRAARNGRIAHPEMQLHCISSPAGTLPGPYDAMTGASDGSLPREELAALASLLRPYTGAPDRACFAVWDGWAQLHGSPAVARFTIPPTPTGPVPGIAPQEVRDGPRLELPNRPYVLLRGAVDDAVAVADLLQGQSANLWWPDDRAWCVATEVDFAWTYVGGAEEAIAVVLASPVLEALPARITDGITFDSDLLNTALDEP